MTAQILNASAANSLAARDIAYYIHSFTDLRRFPETGPLIITRGEGVRVFDDDGKGYIEACGGLWCTSLGFSEGRLADAANNQMRKLPYYHSFFGKAPDVAIELAEKLINLAPPPMARVIFANSGSEANDAAIKMVRLYNNALGRPRKKKIIARQSGYHGVNIGSGSLSGLSFVHGGFDLPMAGVLHTDTPHFYLGGHAGESEEAFASRLASNLDRLIEAEDPDSIAAFIAEPVMGAGGVIVPPATYFEKVQAVLKKHDVLFIADEVICGFGRTGNWWGSETYGITPDLVTSAKGLSSAYVPISALMMSDAVYQAIVEGSAKHGLFGHGHTYSGHPVGAAVALETLRIYEEMDVVARVRELSPRLLSALKRFTANPIVGEVRGVGLMAAVHLVKDQASRQLFEPAEGVGAFLVARAQEYGLITRSLRDSVAFAPPLIISEAEIDEMVAMFGKALADTEAWVAAGMPRI